MSRPVRTSNGYATPPFRAAVIHAKKDGQHRVSVIERRTLNAARNFVDMFNTRVLERRITDANGKVIYRMMAPDAERLAHGLPPRDDPPQPLTDGQV